MTADRLLIALAILTLAGSVAAEDIEPRRWTPLPVGTTVLGVGVIRGEGDISFDPLLKIDDATVERTTALVSVIQAFDLLGKSARVDIRLPQEHARWEGLLAGEPSTADRRGLANPRVRLSVNVLGSPALRGEAFQAYRAEHPVNTVVGAALAVTLPLGEYQKDKLLNLGDNRFTVTPQLGVVHTRGPWSYELTGSVSFYTDNREFYVDHTREQAPLFALQAHAVYTAPIGWWASVGAAYDWGGESTIDGEASGDYREDLLYGVAAGVAIGRQSSVQLAYVANRAQQAIGSDTDNFALGYSVRF